MYKPLLSDWESSIYIGITVTVLHVHVRKQVGGSEKSG